MESLFDELNARPIELVLPKRNGCEACDGVTV